MPCACVMRGPSMGIQCTEKGGRSDKPILAALHCESALQAKGRDKKSRRSGEKTGGFRDDLVLAEAVSERL